MRGSGHHVTGLAAGLAVSPFVADDVIAHGMLALAAWVGGTAPDWMELPYSKNGGRVSLIPHRRITHWGLAWAAALLATLYWLPATPWYPAALGFVVGGLTHLATDIPNPAGVPLLHPWRRTSLHLWKSGQYEGLLMGGFIFAAWASHAAIPGWIDAAWFALAK